MIILRSQPYSFIRISLLFQKFFPDYMEADQVAVTIESFGKFVAPRAFRLSSLLHSTPDICKNDK